LANSLDYYIAAGGWSFQEDAVGDTWQFVFRPVVESDVMNVIPARFSPLPPNLTPVNATIDPINPPVLMNSRARPLIPGNKGNAITELILVYRPLGPQEWLEQHPGKGILHVDAAMRFRRVNHLPSIRSAQERMADHTLGAPEWLFAEGFGTESDVFGDSDLDERYFAAPIEGIDWDGNRWDITKGTNLATQSLPVLSVHAVLANEHMNTFFWPLLSTVGSYNSTILQQFPTFPDASYPGTWLMSRASRRPHRRRGLWNCQFSVIGNPNGWDEPCISGESELRPFVEPIVAKVEDTSVSGQGLGTYTTHDRGSHVVMRWVATGGSRRFQIIPAEDISTLDLMLVDSWGSENV